MNTAQDQRIDSLTQRLQHLETQNDLLEKQLSTIKQHRPLEFHLPKFTGKQDGKTWKEFLCELYEVGNAQGWEDVQYCAYLPKCLEGEPLAAYRLLPKTTRESWKNVLPSLASSIRQGLTPQQAKTKLSACRQEDDEAPSEYMLRVKWLAELAYAVTEETTVEAWTQEQQVRIVITTFRSGLIPEVYAEATRRNAENTPQAELSKVVADNQTLSIIHERRKEHEAHSSTEAAPKDLCARTKQMEVLAKQHRAAVLEALETTSQQETEQQNENYPKRRRKARKYRCRNIHRRHHLHSSSDRANDSKAFTRKASKEEYDA